MHSRMCKFNYECMSVFPYGSPIAIEFEDPSSDDVIVEVAAPNDQYRRKNLQHQHQEWNNPQNRHQQQELRLG